MATLNQSAPTFSRYTLDSVAADGTNTSESINLSGFQSISVQVIHANHSDTSTFALQQSVDGTNWDTISGSSTVTASAAGTDTIDISEWASRLLRFTITEADGGATSTLVAHILAKKKGR